MAIAKTQTLTAQSASAAGGKRLLVFGGVPRSGTSALYRLLMSHPGIFVGNERYLHVFQQDRAFPGMFEKSKFLNISSSDTHSFGGVQDQFSDVEISGRRYDSARIIGDKMAPIWRTYPYIWDLFPEVEILYILRNPVSVAESYHARFLNPNDEWQDDYKTAIKEWNLSVSRTMDQINEGRKISVVSYENLFSNKENVEQLFEHLGLEHESANQGVVDQLIDGFEKLPSRSIPNVNEIRKFVSLHARILVYRDLMKNHCIFQSKSAIARPEPHVAQTNELQPLGNR